MYDVLTSGYDDNKTPIGQIATIKVIGVGSSGNNVVKRMKQDGICCASEFIAANTDKQDLLLSNADVCVLLGERLTRGFGANANPEIGRAACEESKELVREVIDGSDLLFITCGMGGGTGTGAAPVIAEIAKEMGILTVAVVTRPFQFEGPKRMANAQQGIMELKKHVDTLVVIPNEKLLHNIKKGTKMVEAFAIADEALRQGIQGITDLIRKPGIINLDFADIKTVMQGQGLAHMGIGRGYGETKTIDAIRLAVKSPLLETTIEGATGVILNFCGNVDDIIMDEISDAANLVREVVDPSANIIFGTSIDDSLQDEMVITVIASGFKAKPSDEPFATEVPKVTAVPEAPAVVEKPQQEIAASSIPVTRAVPVFAEKLRNMRKS